MRINTVVQGSQGRVGRPPPSLQGPVARRAVRPAAGPLEPATLPPAHCCCWTAAAASSQWLAVVPRYPAACIASQPPRCPGAPVPRSPHRGLQQNGRYASAGGSSYRGRGRRQCMCRGPSWQLQQQQRNFTLAGHADRCWCRACRGTIASRLDGRLDRLQPAHERRARALGVGGPECRLARAGGGPGTGGCRFNRRAGCAGLGTTRRLLHASSRCIPPSGHFPWWCLAANDQRMP
jgi:hypothetical protein